MEFDDIDNTNIEDILVEDEGLQQGIVQYPNSDKARYSKDGNILTSCDTDYEGSFEIPEGVLCIANDAFRKCTKITSVKISSTVQNIGKSAFRETSSLKTIIVDANNVSFITDSQNKALYNVEMTMLIKVAVDVENIKIPEGIESIHSYAFSNCTKLKNIQLPDSVQIIGSNAFIACKALSEVHFNEGLKKLSGWCFRDCTSLKKVVIPNTLRRICVGVFFGCSALEEIVLPDKLTDIGPSAFASCQSLQKIFIPRYVRNIGASLFDDCDSLSEIVVDDNNRSFSSENGVLYNKFQSKLLRCPQTLETIELPELLSSMEESSFYGCRKLKNIILPKYIMTIPDYTFCDCVSLEKIELPENLLNIRRGAFENCRNLKEVIFNQQLKSLGDFAFAGCESLCNIELPEKLIEIGQANAPEEIELGSTFNGCTSLQSIVIPDAIEYLNPYCFNNCKNLQSVTISYGMTLVDNDLFCGCDNLKEVFLRNPNTEIEEGTFNENVKIEIKT